MEAITVAWVFAVAVALIWDFVMEASKILKEKKFWIASFLVVWAAGLQVVLLPDLPQILPYF